MYSEAWELIAGGGGIKRVIHFDSFAIAFDFMNDVAVYAQKINHHPDWRNRYGVVEITLSTWEIKDLSEKDIDLAYRIDQLAEVYLEQEV